MAERQCICKNNKMITCFDSSQCANCGWDNETRRRRVREIKASLRCTRLSLKGCPFCGTIPTITRSGAGMVIIRCGNPACLLAGSDSPLPAEAAVIKWNRRYWSGTMGYLKIPGKQTESNESDAGGQCE